MYKRGTIRTQQLDRLPAAEQGQPKPASTTQPTPTPGLLKPLSPPLPHAIAPGPRPLRCVTLLDASAHYCPYGNMSREYSRAFTASNTGFYISLSLSSNPPPQTDHPPGA
ncbi:hypothetical protein LY78DRAFT_452895 [Colletotrichum sublineola]|nr:hypothetical protein LY78DRAFT_452895 [Colletotrichum sublineola]